MSKKHVVMWLIIGWAVAYVLPPQRVLGMLGIRKSS